jgi:hypothetical protein
MAANCVRGGNHKITSNVDIHSCSFQGILLSCDRLGHMYNSVGSCKLFASDVFVAMLQELCVRRYELGPFEPAV